MPVGSVMPGENCGVGTASGRKAMLGTGAGVVAAELHPTTSNVATHTQARMPITKRV
jgi:hypothetical protein